MAVSRVMWRLAALPVIYLNPTLPPGFSSLPLDVAAGL